MDSSDLLGCSNFCAYYSVIGALFMVRPLSFSTGWYKPNIPSFERKWRFQSIRTDPYNACELVDPCQSGPGGRVPMKDAFQYDHVLSHFSPAE